MKYLGNFKHHLKRETEMSSALNLLTLTSPQLRFLQPNPGFLARLVCRHITYCNKVPLSLVLLPSPQLIRLQEVSETTHKMEDIIA